MEIFNHLPLPENDNIFKTIVEQSSSPVGLYIGKDIVIALANNAILKVWGKDTSVIGKTFRQALPELEGQPFFDILDAVYTTGIPYEAYAERVNLLVNGSLTPFYFNFIYKPLKNNKGEVWGILNTAEDVTELVLTRKKLTENEERINFALESAQLGTWDMHPVQGTIVWDERCKLMHGFSKDDTPVYTDVLKHIHPDDRKLVESNVSKVLNANGNGIFDCEFRTISAENNTLRWLRSRGKAYFDNLGNCIRFAGTAIDITNEINDKDEQRRLITLIDNTSDFISLSDIDGNLTYMNTVGRKMLGLDDNESLPNIKQIVSPGDIDKLNNEISKILFDTGRWSGEISYQHFKTNEIIPVYARTMIMYHENGKVHGRATISRDLRGEIANKQALIYNEHLLQNITSASPTTLWMSDHNGMIIYVNKTWENWTGLSLQDSAGSGWLSALLPEDRDRAAEKFIQDVSTQQNYEVNFRIRRTNGAIRWCIATGNPQYNHDGVFMGYIGSCTDITEKTNTDIQLQLKNDELNDQIKQFEFVTSFMPVQLWTAKPTGEIDYVNKQTLDYSGLPMQEIVGEKWANGVHPDDLPKCLDTWKEALQTGKLYQYEFRLKNKHNEYRWHLSRALPFINDGEIIKWFGTNTDIDEQKQMQRQKDDFLGIASHELKTPVTSIKAYAQVLGAMLSREGEEKKANMVMKMDAQLNRLTNLIGDLLDVTKINSGRILFNKTWFDFNEAVHESVTDLQHTTNKHILVMDFKETGKIYSDKERIGQVITNLVTNAIKYSPHSNRIIISTERDLDMITVCVEDFGIGIPDDKKDKVFEQFYRVSGNKQHTFPGLGLGLYISSEIIKREGGKMWVNSIEGKGATFCFSLPIYGSKTN